ITSGISVTITAPSAITTTASVTSNFNGSQISCNGATDGEITVAVPTTGTAGGYTYNINGGTYQSSNVFTGLGAGTYTLTAKDINGCITSGISVTITAPSAITTTASVTSNFNGSQISCNGATDGTITVVVPTTGTAGGYTYNINGGTYQSSNVFAGLGAGTYTLTAKDINGCTTSGISVTITAPSAITTTASVTSNFNGSQISCNGATDGTITVVVPTTGTAGGYTYNINGGTYQSSNVFTGLGAGTYTLTAKDINGCTTSGISVTITAPSAITTTASVTSNFNGSQISCNGATDGEITVVVPTTGTSGGYTYNINGGTYQPSNVFTGLGAGTYTLTAKDINGCTTSGISVTITAPSAITTTASVTSNYNGSHISCPTSTDGVITVVVPTTGTMGGYTYNINGGTYQSSNVFSGLGAGTYTLTAKDINGCTTSGISVTVVAPAGVAITSATVTSNSGALFSGYGVSCATGQGTSNNGQITVVAGGGSGTLQYSNNGGTSSQATGIFNTLTAGTYNIVVTDGNACTATTTVTVTAPPAIVAGTCTDAQDLCQLNAGQIKVEVSGGVAPYSVAGSGTTVAPSPTVGTAVTVPGSPGSIATSGGNVIFSGLQGNVQYQFIVTDTNGCHIP
ncbi:MAG: beta strand repeat-containing protein, partial [Bacteroidia bacterium]